jgi:cytochrome oxidase Cu insertion factor (SCO1/SenC/PrrC family)
MKYLCILLLVTVVYNPSMGQFSSTVRRGPWMPNYDSLYLGKPYAAFDVTSLGGKKINNATCHGKVTVLDFWFEGCPGCRGEFTQLNQLYDSLKADSSIQFAAITFDSPKELPAFLKENGIKYPVFSTNDLKKFKKLCYGMGSPSKIILDKEEKIASIGLMGFDNSKLSVGSYLSFIRSLK